MALDQEQKYRKLYEHYGEHPIDWLKDMFGHSVEFTPQLIQAFEELGKLVRAKIKWAKAEEMTEEEKRYYSKIGMSISSGQGIGKDLFGALAILFFMDVYPNPKVMVTAPSFNTLQDTIWAEISKWIRKSRKIDQNDPHSPSILDVKLVVQAEKIYRRLKNKEREGKEWFCVARTVPKSADPQAQSETLSGRHEDFMLFLVDEATGVDDPVFLPLEGSLTGIVNIAILIFNPTRTKGFAIRSHFGEDSRRWVTLRWNAEESPRVSQVHVRTMAETYGKDSNRYRIRVLGLPPTSDTDSLIPMDWIENAINKDLMPRKEDPLIFGCDFGAGGDQSVIVPRKGCKIYPIRRNSTKDSNKLTEWVKEHFDLLKADQICGDEIGIGWAVLGNLRALLEGYTVHSVKASSNADADERFHNKRAEMHWRVRERFEDGTISIPNDQDLIEQLSSIKYFHDNKGRIQIVEKKKVKDIVGHSPDESDGLCFTFAKRDSVFSVEDREEERDRGEDKDEMLLERAWMGA